MLAKLQNICAQTIQNTAPVVVLPSLDRCVYMVETQTF